MKKYIFYLISSMLLTLTYTAQAEQIIWQTTGFQQPESVVIDDKRQQFIVSNINGNPDEANQQGYLSLLDRNGKIVQKKWVEDLNAPKGMVIVGDQLFVSDLQQIRVIDLNKGVLTKSYQLPDAIFLNDMTADGNGHVYVSDMMSHSIYKYNETGFELWLQDPQLAHPNGLFIDGDIMYVGSWGQQIQQDFSTKVLGGLLSVDLHNKAITVMEHTSQIGNIDGIVKIAGQLFFNDWINGKLHRLDADGNYLMLGQFAKGLADISAANDILIMPYMLDGKVIAIKAPLE